MRYWRRMWIAPSLEDRKASLFRSFLLGRPDRSVYLIALSEDGSHLLDIYPGHVLRQKYYRRSAQTVIGAAGSREEAEELSGSILAGVYFETGGFSLLNSLNLKSRKA